MTPSKSTQPLKSRVARDRVLFYLGILMSIVGGPVFALGSYAHDVYNIPVIGEAYGVFGWLNTTFLYVGVAILIIGIAAVVFSLRGGILPNRTTLEDVT